MVSARVTELLGRYSGWLEVYSIDEAFLRVNGIPEDPANPWPDHESSRAAEHRRTGLALLWFADCC